jgi:hypothetical protein
LTPVARIYEDAAGATARARLKLAVLAVEEPSFDIRRT